MSDLTMSMFANRQDYEAAVAAQKAITPHDELMALAGKAAPGEWEAGGGSDPTAILAREGWAQVAMTNDALPEAGDNAAFIAAACNFVRSDAFRAMVRDAERYRWLRDGGTEELCVRAQGENHVHKHLFAYYRKCSSQLDAAIDAAASGTGRGK